MTPLLFGDLYARLDDELRYVFDERAGIVEFDAHKPRELAECLALIELLREFPSALLGFKTLQLNLDGRPLWVLARSSIAEKLCTQRAAKHVDLSKVLETQFGGVAVLSDCPMQLRETSHLI